MSELIRREDAIKATYQEPLCTDPYNVMAEVRDRIKALQAASPWHRVEEELPNDGEWAIFTNGKVVSVERFKVDAYNHFFPASKWFDFEDAIAWMPIPEPPKEENK